MKTESISVPHFEGYKCVGYKVPKLGQYYCKDGFLVEATKTHFTTEWLVYEKLPPKRYIFEETGEYRTVKNGDYYLFENHIFYRSNDEESLSFYKILRKVDEGQN